MDYKKISYRQEIKKGGELLFEGLPEDLLKCERSLTGKYLKPLL